MRHAPALDPNATCGLQSTSAPVGVRGDLMSCRVVTFLLLAPIFAAPGRVSAQATPAPAPAPAISQPKRDGATAPGASATAADHDTTTPRGTLKVLAAALRDGDGQRIRQVMYATSPAETRMVAAMADMAK